MAVVTRVLSDLQRLLCSRNRLCRPLDFTRKTSIRRVDSNIKMNSANAGNEDDTDIIYLKNSSKSSVNSHAAALWLRAEFCNILLVPRFSDYIV